MRERGSQITNQIAEQSPCLRRVHRDERIEIGQRVEQEMRFDLRLQRAQLRFDGGAFGALYIALALRELDPAEIDEQRNAACDEREHDAHDPDVALVQAEDSGVLTTQEQL